MGIRKRGKTWWVDITAPSGERVRCSAQTEDRREAQEYHDRLKSELWRVDKLKEKPKRTWDEAALRWLESLSNPRTIVNAEIRLAWLQNYLRGHLLTNMSTDLVEEIARKRGKNVSGATVNRYLGTISAVLNLARKTGWIETVPVLRKREEKEKRVRFLTHAEAARLLKELPPHQRDLADFALRTGLRQRNILELSWSQVDLQRNVCWIHPDQAKGERAIGVPLGKEVVDILRRQKGNHEERVFVFNGHPIRQVNTKAWKKALKRAGITNFRWHDLRHTLASWHIQAGTPLAVLQELGGWADYKMVGRYAHLSKDHLSAYAENLGYGTNSSHPKFQII